MIKNTDGGIEYLQSYSDVGIWPIDTIGLNIPVIIGLSILLFACVYLLIRINIPKNNV